MKPRKYNGIVLPMIHTRPARHFLVITRYYLFSNVARLLEVRSSQRLYMTCALAESCPENAIGVLKHAVLERDDDEL